MPLSVPAQPNIVLIHCHDLGTWLPCYGMGSVPSPHLNKFADESIVFEHAFATAPLCTPARSSLFTGLQPHQNGLMGLVHSGWRYRPGVETLPELLRPHSYHSALIGLQHEDLDSRVLGYDEVHGLGFLPRAMEVARHTEQWLQQPREDSTPFFLTLGTWETHRPWPAEDYEAADPSAVDVPAYLPDNADTRGDIAAFHGSIRQLDEAIGRILGALDASPHAENTLVIFTTDHGAAFPRAKSTLYDSGVQVAFMVRPPRTWEVAPGRRARLTSHLDVAPTLIELAGGEPPQHLVGESFLSALQGEDRTDPTRALVLEKSHHDRYDPIRAIRTDRAKYIRNFRPGPQVPLALDLEESPTRRGMGHLLPPKPSEELYLLRDDPAELRNLAEEPGFEDLRAELAGRLDHCLRSTADPVLDGDIPAPPVPDRDTRATT